MKKFFSILIFSGFLIIHGSDLWAQETVKVPANLQQMIETPPADPLKANLAVAQEQMSPLPGQANANAVTALSASPTDDFSKNPFVPQVPQAVKAAPTTPQTTAPGPAAAEKVAPIPQFIVTGIVWHTKKPQAIVNGEVVVIGDQVSNWAVTEITRDGVQVNYQTQSLWIKPIVDPQRTTQTPKAPPRPNR